MGTLVAEGEAEATPQADSEAPPEVDAAEGTTEGTANGAAEPAPLSLRRTAVVGTARRMPASPGAAAASATASRPAPLTGGDGSSRT